jgi:hypothetical protein
MRYDANIMQRDIGVVTHTAVERGGGNSDISAGGKTRRSSMDGGGAYFRVDGPEVLK